MKREAILLDHPLLNRKRVFSTTEAKQVLGWSETDLHQVLFRLVRKGKLMRIKRGLFCFVPPGTGKIKGGYPQNWFLIVKALVAGKSYFISHYSAMHLHGMTTGAIQTIFISVSEQRRLPKALRIPIRLITVPKKRFWGLEEKWVTNEEKVSVSNLERTILDILDRPSLSGGISEIARGLWLVKKEINFSRLVEYAKCFDSLAALKRLGFLSEKFDLVQKKSIDDIHECIKRSPSYAFLDPLSEKEGKYVDRWRLRINVDMDNIQKNVMT